MSIKFVDPPKDARKKYDHAAIVAALKSRPNEWARILEDVNPSYASRLKDGSLSAYRDGSFEFRTHTTDGSSFRGDIYARYVGE